MSINPGYKVIEPKKQMPFWLFAIICFLAVIVAGLSLYLILPKEHTVGKPYALKQNGDTLFIPTQVVVRHDTLVVIRTTDSVMMDRAEYYYEPTDGRFHRYDSGLFILSGGWGMHKSPLFTDGATRDTIYEHKIIYY